MKRAAGWLALAGGGLALAAGLAFQFSHAVQDGVFAAGARRQLALQSQLPLTDDALRVLLCGTSSPLPRPKAAKACTLVAAGGRLFIVDIGPEAAENLAFWRVPTPRVEAVFITHFHSDHIGELGELNSKRCSDPVLRGIVVCSVGFGDELRTS